MDNAYETDASTVKVGSLDAYLELAERLTNLVVGIHGFKKDVASTLKAEQAESINQIVDNLTAALLNVSAEIVVAVDR